MPLYLVIGYPSRRMSAEEAQVLYSGPSGAVSKEILSAPNADFPARERFIRPTCNGGRRVDAAQPPADPSNPSDQPDPSTLSEEPAEPSPEPSAEPSPEPSAESLESTPKPKTKK